MDAITSLRQAATVKPTPMQPVKTTHAAGEATADGSQVRYVWNYGPMFGPSGEFICQATARKSRINATPLAANRRAVEELEVLVVGAGFAGLYQLDHLRTLVPVTAVGAWLQIKPDSGP